MKDIKISIDIIYKCCYIVNVKVNNIDLKCMKM